MLYCQQGLALEWPVTSQVTARPASGISITTAYQNYAPSQTGHSMLSVFVLVFVFEFAFVFVVFVKSRPDQPVIFQAILVLSNLFVFCISICKVTVIPGHLVLVLQLPTKTMHLAKMVSCAFVLIFVIL